MKASELAQRLAENVEATVQYLLPNAVRKGDELHVGSLAGEVGNSLKVRISGPKAGIWSDFATGVGGDLLDLWACKRNISLSQAIKEVRQYLNIDVSLSLRREPKKAVSFEIKERTTVFPSESEFNTRLIDQATKKYLCYLKDMNIHCFPYYFHADKTGKRHIVNIKYLIPGTPRKVWSEKDGLPCLFGWQAINENVRSIVITEGEIDAMSLYEYGFPALSIPYGAGKGAKQAWIENEIEYLEYMDAIYLCMDMDKPGQETAEYLAERLGRHKCRIVKLPYKDANECLMKGITKEQIKICFDEAKIHVPERLKNISEFYQDVYDRFFEIKTEEFGYVFPWEKTYYKIRLRPGELSVWTGINGHGKSQLLGHVVVNLINQNVGVCMASLEMKASVLIERMILQACGMAKDNITKQYFNRIYEWLKKKLYVIDILGNATAEELIKYFRFARQCFGVEVFVVDSLMKCGINEDDYNSQKDFVNQLCAFKNEYNCQVHLVAHPRKGADEDRIPSKLDVRGTGVISDLADNCFTVYRYKGKQHKINHMLAQGKSKDSQEFKDILEKPDTYICCDKQRDTGWEGKIALWFNPNCYQFLSTYKERPRRYVE